MSPLLNSDLGESFGSWRMGMDSHIMPHIQQANIACGFHAGDGLVMLETLALAKQHKVEIGAHPSYPDRQGFGRRTMQCSAQELHGDLLYQISALDGLAASTEQTLSYVKPHGALYNDMMKNAGVRQTVMQAVSQFHRPLKLMLQATPQASEHQREAAELGLTLYFEAFADRGYDDNGLLLPRDQAGGLLNKEQTLQQVRQIKEHSRVISHTGKVIPLTIDSVCVHGDNPDAVELAAEIHQLLNE